VANNAADLGISALAGYFAPSLINEAGLASGPPGWAVALTVDAVLFILELIGFDLFGGGGSAPVIPPGYYQMVSLKPHH
jgi:hypothetical protein